jgi:ATP-dependent RNA helicase DHX57
MIRGRLVGTWVTERMSAEKERREEEGGRRKEEGGRRKEEGGRRKEEGGRRKEEGMTNPPMWRALSYIIREKGAGEREEGGRGQSPEVRRHCGIFTCSEIFENISYHGHGERTIFYELPVFFLFGLCRLCFRNFRNSEFLKHVCLQHSGKRNFTKIIQIVNKIGFIESRWIYKQKIIHAQVPRSIFLPHFCSSLPPPLPAPRSPLPAPRSPLPAPRSPLPAPRSPAPRSPAPALLIPSLALPLPLPAPSFPQAKIRI